MLVALYIRVLTSSVCSVAIWLSSGQSFIRITVSSVVFKSLPSGSLSLMHTQRFLKAYVPPMLTSVTFFSQRTNLAVQLVSAMRQSHYLSLEASTCWGSVLLVTLAKISISSMSIALSSLKVAAVEPERVSWN